MKNLNFLLLCSALALTSCFGSDEKKDDPTPDTEGATAFGQYITVPEITANDVVTELRLNNRGVYFKMDRDITANLGVSWIYRMEQADGTPSWNVHKYTSHIYGFHPLKATSEQPNEFSVFYWDLSKNGYTHKNNGLPSSEEATQRELIWGPKHIVVDKGQSPTKWAFYDTGSGLAVKRKRSDNTNTYDYVVQNFNGSVSVVEPDDNDAIIWAGGGSKVYRVTASGIQTISLDSFGGFGPSSQETVSKIRVVNDVVWVGTGSRIFRIQNGTQVSLFRTMSGTAASLGGGNFAVDNQYIYTNDGDKIDYRLNTTTSFIPAQPQTSDQQVLMDYITMKNDLQTSQSLEVSTDPLDRYIYTWTLSNKILRVKKSL